jgi:WD40 repeat protein
VGAAGEAITAPLEGNGQPGEDGVPETWRPGDVILDLYEVREAFTSGGMGLVYRVRHRGWNLDLAVKCPRPEYFLSERDKENFEREAETWVKLGPHPHVVTCYYVRRLGGIPRVFAEFVNGGSLAEWIHGRKLYQGGPDEALERILDVAIQLAWGLQHAHEQGLVHRDVKPGNVLRTADGVAKVTDFGMARARGITARLTEGEGPRSILVSAGGLTPAFCSPEQALGRPVSRKTDVWSWGVSVLEAFTGAATWSAGHLAGEALETYLANGPDDTAFPPMPRALAELLRLCFRRDPEARPRDMLEIVEVLREAYRRATGRKYPRETPRPAEALPDGLNNRAVSLLDLNKRPEAERLWQEALKADPNHPESTYNLGLAQWRAGRLSNEALRQKLNEVLASRPGEWLPPYLLALWLLDQGDWPAAATTLEKITGAGATLEEVRSALALAKERLAGPRLRIRTLEGHSGWVSSVAVTGDGRFALSGSADRTLRLWDVATGQCLRTFRGHGEWVTSVRISGDGRLAASGSADRTLRLWDVASGQCTHVCHGHFKWVLAVALSGDGRHVLTGSGDGSLRLWDVATGTCLHSFEGHSGPVLAVALGEDARQALSGGRDGSLMLWDTAGGECLRAFLGHADRVQAIALSADGKLALSGSGDRTVKLWEVATGRCLRTLEGHAGAVQTVALTADGRHALSGGADRTVKYWSLITGHCLATLAGHDSTVHAVALRPGGRHALSGSGDRTLALWALPQEVSAPYVVSRVLPSETALAARADYEQALARAWRAVCDGDAAGAAWHVRAARSQPGYRRRPETMSQWSGLYVRLARKTLNGGWEGHAFEGHLGAVTSVCLRFDGRYALSGSADRTLKLWEVATGQCLRTFQGHQSTVTSVCLGADGRIALSGGADHVLKLWETSTDRCLATFEGHEDVITSVALGPDGRCAMSASLDRTLKLWDTATGRCLRTFEGHADPVHAFAWSADGRWALSGGAQFLVRKEGERVFTSGQLLVWDVAAGRCLPAFEGDTGAVTAVALSPDGRLALTGGGPATLLHSSGRFAQTGLLQWWDTADGHCLHSSEGHPDAVTSVQLSYDGRFALSGSADRTLRLWEMATGQCLRAFQGHGDAVTAVCLSTDGRFALSGSADRTLRLWVLDWELEDNRPADWDEGARPYLATFLTLHVPYAAPLPAGRRRTMKEIVNLPLGQLFRPGLPAAEEITRALTRRGKPVWTEEDFERLLYALGCAGFGWLRPEGVRNQLEQMARQWEGPPPLPRA